MSETSIGDPIFGGPRTALMARTLAGVLLFGLIASLFLHARGRNTSDHYTPPTTPGDRAALKVGEDRAHFTLPNAEGDPFRSRRSGASRQSSSSSAPSG